MKERRPSGEPALAEVGPPVILSLDVAGYLSVLRTLRSAGVVRCGPSVVPMVVRGRHPRSSGRRGAPPRCSWLASRISGLC
jgi:hypothetical protein